MMRTRFCLPLAAAAAVLAVSLVLSPAGADAEDRFVPTDYPSIQAAVTAAVSGDSVWVDPGIYVETITLKDGVSIFGIETARTFLSGNGAGPLVIADGTVVPINASIRNFTFINASIGIRISNNPSGLKITNNVFHVGTSGVAIAVQNSLPTEVINNTFFQNGTAVSSDTDIKITNNIFANNTAALSNAYATKILNNAFSGIQSGPTGTPAVTGDPLFVDAVNHDFHLRENSPCINTGSSIDGTNFGATQTDIGAYGGPSADLIAFPVAGLTITETTDTSISLTWAPNNSYLMTMDANALGTYWLYYGTAAGDYTGAGSPFVIVAPEAVFTLTDLSSSATPPSAPVLDQPSPRDSKLVLTWSAVSGATGYKVYYGLASQSQFSTTLDVGNTTSYTLAGLTTGQSYRVAVSAYAQAQYFMAVIACSGYGIGCGQNLEYESDYSSEVSVKLGQPLESALSNVRIDFPETVTSYPLLPDSRQGCFIATAAYGYYSSPEVQALRDFRDRYLLSTAFGRAGVDWYYQHGPAAASFLNAHPGYKPAVRAALMPAVGAALIMTRTSMVMKAGILLIIGFAFAFVGSRRLRQPKR